MIAIMRTTVTLDADVEQLIRRAVRERDQSFKSVLNSAIRDGLSRSRKKTPFRQKTYRMGRPAGEVDLTKALRLAAEIEDREIRREIENGK